MRILVVEDDPDLQRQMKTALAGAGYVVDVAADGEEGHFLGDTEPYDAVVLDLGLPGEDGVACLMRWRARGETTPVLVLTARDAVASRIDGLDAGADDYLVKPIALGELAARLRAVARRACGRPQPVWKHGDLEYNPASKEALWCGEAVALTSREAALLEVLLANPGRVLSKRQILEKLYGWADELQSNAIEVFVHNLRRKIAPDVVRTVRGVGYALGSGRRTP